MQLIAITGRATDASRETFTSSKIDLALANWLAAAADGDVGACFDLGVAYSTGSNGADCDLGRSTQSGLTWLLPAGTRRQRIAGLTLPMT